MARRAIQGLIVGAALVWSSPAWAIAASGPDRAFVDKADGVCLRATVKLVKLSPPPKGYGTSKLTTKILRELAPFLTHELAIDRAQVRQWGAIGRPTAPAIRVAWARWLVLWKNVELPALSHASADAKRGDLQGFTSSFAAVEAHTAEARKLVKMIGFHDCDWQQ